MRMIPISVPSCWRNSRWKEICTSLTLKTEWEQVAAPRAAQGAPRGLPGRLPRAGMKQSLPSATETKPGLNTRNDSGHGAECPQLPPSRGWALRIVICGWTLRAWAWLSSAILMNQVGIRMSSLGTTLREDRDRYINLSAECWNDAGLELMTGRVHIRSRRPDKTLFVQLTTRKRNMDDSRLRNEKKEKMKARNLSS